MIASLNALDITILVILFLSIMFGILKGFIRELLSLAFFIIAVVLAFLFYHEIGNVFMKSIKNRDMANFLGYTTVFVVVLIAGAIVTYFTKKVFNFGPLKSIDMILGGVFGLIRGILIGSIIVFALITFPVNDNLLTKSRLSPYAIKTIDIFFQLLPVKYHKRLKFKD